MEKNPCYHNGVCICLQINFHWLSTIGYFFNKTKELSPMWMYSKGADSSDIYGIEEVLSLACFMPIGDHKQEIDGIAFLAV